MSETTDIREGWHRVELEGIDLKQEAHYYKGTEVGPLSGYESLCGLGMAGQNIDLDISEVPILPICKTCLAEYKRLAQ